MYGNSRTEVRLSPAKIRRRAQDLVPGSSAFLSLRVRSWQKKLWLGFDIALAQGTAPLAHACDGRQPGQALGPPQESEEQRQLPLLSLLASYGPAGGVTISSPPDRDIRGVCQGGGECASGTRRHPTVIFKLGRTPSVTDSEIQLVLGMLHDEIAAIFEE